jgi:hypothetical protein
MTCPVLALDIQIVPGPTLARNDAALAAAERAAEQWEQWLRDPVRIRIDADLANLESGVIAQASSHTSGYRYNTVLEALRSDAADELDDHLVRWLPSLDQIDFRLPEGWDASGLVLLTSANAKALGIPNYWSFRRADGTIHFNLEMDFDQFDLVSVLQSSKYRTGSAATWGEGDWDGSGEDHGDPPAGNRVFDQLDLVAALSTGNYLSGPYAPLGAGPQLPGDWAKMSLASLPVESRQRRLLGENLAGVQAQAHPFAAPVVPVCEPRASIRVLCAAALLLLALGPRLGRRAPRLDAPARRCQLSCGNTTSTV